MQIVFNSKISNFKDGIDAGGLRRSFNSLIVKGINENHHILNGSNGHKYLNYDVEALDEKLYSKLAILVGFLGVNCITYTPIFEKKYFKFLINNTIDAKDVYENFDQNISNIIDCIRQDEKWPNNDLVLDCLSSLGIRNIKKYETNKSGLIQLIIKHNVYDKNISCIQQFRETLSSIGVLEHAKQHFDLWSSILCEVNNNKVDAEKFINLFDTTKIKQQTNEGSKEQDTIYYLNKFVRNCENGDVNYNGETVKLEDIVEFLTGGDFVPIGGFDKKIEFSFYDARWKQYVTYDAICDPLPKAQTCGLIFTCPRNCPKYSYFEKVMAFVVMECKEFGHH